MTDGTFSLFDKQSNEIAFNSSGAFIGIKYNKPKGKFVKSLSMGGHMIKFSYKIYKNNQVYISKVRLFNLEDNSKPIYIVNYIYDIEGRLAKIERTNNTENQLSMK